MRKRHNATPWLESMEDRVVPSILGINVSPSVTAEFHKLGNHISSYANSFKNYIESLNQRRTGQSVQTRWPTSHTASHHTSNTLFGIPWLKI
ncbi:MAG: hypothetical protein WBX00_37295 [Isosphaeraceae bacterium]